MLGVCRYQSFRGPVRLTNYNFHTHVQYCITIHYHSCSIDKYRNVEGPKCHNIGRLGISHFEKAGHLSSGQLDPISTTLGHGMPLPGGTSDQRSV